MMKLLLVLFFTQVIANDNVAVMENCRKQAELHGDGVNPESVDRACHDIIRANADRLRFGTDIINLVEAFGEHNMLYIDQYEEKDGKTVLKKSNIIAGDQGFFKNIQAIEMAPELKRAYVLANEGKLVVSFDYHRGGNIAPQTKLEVVDDGNASNINISEDTKKLFLIYNNPVKIVAYKLKAHTGHASPEFGTRIQWTLDQNIIAPVDAVASKKRNELYVLDNGNSIMIFKIQGHIPKLLRSIHGPRTMLNGALEIDIDDQKGLLIVTNGDEKVLTFPTSGSGDIAPTAQ